MENTETIPIFELPLKAQKFVISDVHFADVIELTTMSTKFHRLLQGIKLNVDEYKLIRLLGNAIIQLRTSRGNMAFEPDVYLKGEQRKINGLPATVKSFGRRNCQVEFKDGAFDNKTKSLEKITEHLLSFLNVERFMVELDKSEDDKSSLKSLFIWKKVQHFHEVRVSPSIHCPAIKLSPEEMCFFIDGLKFDKLYLDVQSSNHTKYLAALKGKQAVIMDSSWIDFDQLVIGATVESVKFQVDFQFPDRAINRILHEWMTGKYEKLEELKIQAKRAKPGADVMLNLEGTASIFTVDQMSRRIGRNYSTRRTGDVDIRRAVDGRLATLVTMDNSLMVFFWHDKHFKEIGLG